MNINNNGSIIYHQNNYEINQISSEIQSILLKMEDILSSDNSLLPEKRLKAQTALRNIKQELATTSPVKENILKTLDVLKEISSVSGLVFKVISLFG